METKKEIKNKEKEAITKEDLILLELKHINKELDTIKNNDLTHIEQDIKELGKGLSKVDKEVHGVKSQMNIIIPIIVALLALILGLYFK